MPATDSNSTGRVYLVGAGPGDPGLITLRGVELLRRADAVLYDYLVNPQILGHAAADAELICLGRHGQGRIMSQDDVNSQLVEFARAGKMVVRLKSGDPTVFAHIAEEIEALTAAGIPFEIVSGITAAMAAASFAGIPVTHRDLASSVALVTGQESGEGKTSKLDYSSLAAFSGTLVFYMGVTSSPHWTTALMDAGLSADTPAVILRRCSWSDQQTINCTLRTVVEKIQAHSIRPPVLVIVGDVCRAAARSTWFTDRPLFGQTVLVTRPRHQSLGLCQRLSEFGAGCLVQPAIDIQPPSDWRPVDAALEGLSGYDWLVFSSANGVRGLMDRMWQRDGDLRCLGGVKLAVIGPRTADELANYRLRPDVEPSQFRAEALAEELAGAAVGKRFLLVRASRGREVLSNQLAAAGGAVDQIVVYESVDVEQPSDEVRQALVDDSIDWTTVTSSAIARSLVSMFGERLRNTRLASISPVTSDVLRELGFQPAVEATQYTADGVVEAILNAV
ncbi:MAG: uroporphyrinogen-III C-methyltransferase [Pirellulales bacterium]